MNVMKVHRSVRAVLQAQQKDPEFQKEWERTAVARAVALRLVRYRQQNGLSQTGLARLLGMKQPAVARLEAGDHTPRLETLLQVSRKLGIEVAVVIGPNGASSRSLLGDVSEADVVERVTTEQGRLVVALA